MRDSGRRVPLPAGGRQATAKLQTAAVAAAAAALERVEESDLLRPTAAGADLWWRRNGLGLLHALVDGLGPGLL